MRRSEQIRLLGLLRSGLDRGRDVYAENVVECPLHDYTDPALLAKERMVLFQDTPLLMGLSGDLPGPESYWADSQTGIPVLLTRDHSGKFGAFANICRHRAAQVVPDGRGIGDRFSCPYHSWTYSNRGDLLAINRSSRFGTDTRAELGLFPLRSLEHLGMLWLSRREEAAFDPDHVLGGLQDDMMHWDLPALTFGGSQTIDVRANWKLILDTFGEVYHVDSLHRDTLANEVCGNAFTFDVFGRNCRMVLAYANAFELARYAVDAIEEWPFRDMTLSIYIFFPNTVLMMNPYFIDLLRVFPHECDPGRSRVAHSYYIAPGAAPMLVGPRTTDGEWDRRFALFNPIVVNQDFRVAESIQKCAEAGLQEFINFGRNEAVIQHLHNVRRSSMGRHPLRPIRRPEEARAPKL